VTGSGGGDALSGVLAGVRARIAVYSTPGGGGWLAVQTLEGSFSSVSKPIFATKYSFCSIFRDLQDLQTFAPLQIQNFSQKSSNFFREWILNYWIIIIQFSEFLHWILPFWGKTSMNFSRNFAKIFRKSQNLSIIWWDSRKMQNFFWKLFFFFFFFLFWLRARVASGQNFFWKLAEKNWKKLKFIQFSDWIIHSPPYVLLELLASADRRLRPRGLARHHNLGGHFLKRIARLRSDHLPGMDHVLPWDATNLNFVNHKLNKLFRIFFPIFLTFLTKPKLP